MMKRQILILSIILVSIQALALAATTRHVPSLLYPKIQDAINASSPGDIVMILPGDYNIPQSSGGSTVLSTTKDITIRSLNPDDPCTVANTHIFGGFWIYNATANMKISGLTITGNYSTSKACNGKDTPCGNDANDGQNASPINGGGIRLIGTASPTITNCVFMGCSIRAGSGGDGACPGGNGGWGGWAHGGAVYVDVGGSPIFKKCLFQDNVAQGGDGGNGCTTRPGGHGGSWDGPHVTWEWEPSGGYLPYNRYSGYGGAVFCDVHSTPTFIDCNFVNNRAIGGSCGLSDTGVDGWPQQHYKIERYGGAVYCAANSAPDFNNCSFVDNQADVNGLATHRDTTATAVDNDYIAYGGAIAYEGSAAPKFANCTVNGNLAHIGGAAYDEGGAGQFSDCDFVGNSALVGGAICMVDSTDIITTSQISGNHATTASAAGGGIYVLGGNVAFTDSAISDNTAASGGGVFIDSGITTLFRNCLITGNSANTDGGGISTTWDSKPTIANCTIADNSVSGTGGYGGGVNVAYGSSAQIINSIIWGNSAVNGNQIAIGSNGLPPDANIIVSYSNVQDGAAGVYFYTGVSPRYLQWDYNSVLTGLTDPLFIAGYYLSQPPDQTTTSPCVNKGNLDANDHSLHLWRGTTSTSNKLDTGKVDMGYHYVRTADIAEDYNFDGKVDILDLALFFEWWLSSGCNFPYWCDGRDLNQDGTVNFIDENIFANNYGEMETTPPSPNPMTWAVQPYYVASPVSVRMTATKAVDNSGYPVQYYFQRTDVNGAPDGIIRNWNSDPNYTDTGVIVGKTYGYRVKARDVKSDPSKDAETALSVIAYVTAIGGGPGAPEKPSGLTATPVSATQINLSWTDNSSDETGFKIVRNGSPLATVGAGVKTHNDTGLTAATTYSYQVYAYNGSGNSTYSNTASATTPAEGNEPNQPLTLPTPSFPYNLPPAVPVDGVNSGQTKTDPNGSSSSYWWHKIVTIVPTGTPLVYYRFYCTSQSGFSSPWFPSSGIDAITHDLSPIGSGNPNPRVIYGTNAITYCVPVTMGSVGLSLNWRVDVSFNPDGSGEQNHSATKTIYAP